MPVTQAMSVLGASPVTNQPNSTKIIPAIHFMLRSFLNLTFLSLALSILFNLLKCWSNPQINHYQPGLPYLLVPESLLRICLNPVVLKNFSADKTRQEYPNECTQYYQLLQSQTRFARHRQRV
jgi:hypothetical protein